MEGATGPELQSLIRRLADGDRSAFHPAFAILWPVVRRLAAARLTADDAEDVAQETLLRIFRRIGEFDRSRSALAWAIGIAGYEIRTARRRRQRRREESAAPGALEERAAGAPDPESVALMHDLETALRALVGTLSPRDAETLRLYARGGRPAIASATFRKRVERALARLRGAWRTTHGPI